ncbi:hypothetical protein B0T24DRAFT_681211 [Lasiosphaeria ovina]|uniref:Ankyrin repeat protein n=1 Tax=Lasiosphaeria ovina TaxID=92902 RepID=A0AAE0K3Y6_9PEZI|nr:hypothetical protein B0T24DRAFT_681211 [Lasiosphaeria ovina]
MPSTETGLIRGGFSSDKAPTGTCVPSFNGSTPLMFVSRAANSSYIETLLAAGARPDDQNAWQVSALVYTMRIESAGAGDATQVACLAEYGARPRSSEGGLFALLLSQMLLSGRHVDVAAVLPDHFGTQLQSRERSELLAAAEEKKCAGPEMLEMGDGVPRSPAFSDGYEVNDDDDNDDDDDDDDMFFESLEAQDEL